MCRLSFGAHRGKKRGASIFILMERIVIAAFIYVRFISHVEWIIKRKFYLPFTRNQLRAIEPNKDFTTFVLVMLCRSKTQSIPECAFRGRTIYNFTLSSHRNTGDALKDSYFMNIIQCLHPYQCAGVAIKFRFRLPKMQISSTEWLARFFLVLVYLVFTFRLHSCVPKTIPSI